MGWELYKSETGQQHWAGLSTDTKPTDIRVTINDTATETDTNDRYEYTSSGWLRTRAGGADLIVDLGIASQRHNRYETVIGYATTLTGLVSWAQSENVRRYRVFPSATMRVVEDAANVAQAEDWLETEAAKSVHTTDDAEYIVAAGGEWSDWQELSKDADDDSLSNLYFGLDASGTGATVIVEAE